MVKPHPPGTHRHNKNTEGGMAYYETESHHIPCEESFKHTNLTSGWGIAIVMDKRDHKKTPSHPKSSHSREYRQIQKNLIDQNGYQGYVEAFKMDVENLKNIPWNKPYSNAKNLKLYDKYREEIATAEKQLYSKEFRELAEKKLRKINSTLAQNSKNFATNNQDQFSNFNSNIMSKHTAKIQLDGSIIDSIQQNFNSHIKKYQQLDILDDKEGLGFKEQERIATDIAVLTQEIMSGYKINPDVVAESIIYEQNSNKIMLYYTNAETEIVAQRMAEHLNSESKQYITEINKKLQTDKYRAIGQEGSSYYLQLTSLIFQPDPKIENNTFIIEYTIDHEAYAENNKNEEIQGFSPSNTPTFKRNEQKLIENLENLVSEYITQEQSDYIKKTYKTEMKKMEDLSSELLDNIDTILIKQNNGSI